MSPKIQANVCLVFGTIVYSIHRVKRRTEHRTNRTRPVKL